MDELRPLRQPARTLRSFPSAGDNRIAMRAQLEADHRLRGQPAAARRSRDHSLCEEEGQGQEEEGSDCAQTCR